MQLSMSGLHHSNIGSFRHMQDNMHVKLELSPRRVRWLTSAICEDANIICDQGKSGYIPPISLSFF
jgi:hypothetical protein